METAPAGGTPYASVEDCELAQQDQRRVRKYFRPASKRRAVPSGAPPAELWLMRMEPSNNIDTTHMGVGCNREAPEMK
eukprot:1218978-Pyramimonas_sp.AAC.1